MKSVVDLEIDVPLAEVAALFADPRQNTHWMDDLERVEPISGELGMPGSKYRLVLRKGTMVFVATVAAGDLPGECRLNLEAADVTVAVKGTFTAIAPARTRLVSEEVFRFNRPLRRALGLLARGAIKKAHRRHMEAFKRFAEARG